MTRKKSKAIIYYEWNSSMGERTAKANTKNWPQFQNVGFESLTRESHHIDKKFNFQWPNLHALLLSGGLMMHINVKLDTSIFIWTSPRLASFFSLCIFLICIQFPVISSNFSAYVLLYVTNLCMGSVLDRQNCAWLKRQTVKHTELLCCTTASRYYKWIGSFWWWQKQLIKILFYENGNVKFRDKFFPHRDQDL